MRRTPEATEPSDLMRKAPALAVLSRWVPPQNSMEKSPISTTRTVSPYFSPKRAMAPRFLASSMGRASVTIGSAREDLVVDQTVDLGELLGRDGLKVREVEAQAVRLDQRACLMRMVAQHAS